MSDTAIVIPEVEAGLTALQHLSQSIVVHDAATCLQAKTAQVDVRNYMKDVHRKLDPFVDAAKANLAKAKAELDRWIVPAQAIDSALAMRVKDFERKEREAAEAEERRINEERRIEAARKAEEERKEREKQAEADRKRREAEIEAQRKAGEVGKREAERLRKEAAEAAEREKVRAAADAQFAAVNVETVHVEPSIPKVAGVPSRRNWKFRIIIPQAIPARYCSPDEVKIGRMVRDAKNKAWAEAECPGIEVYED